MIQATPLISTLKTESTLCIYDGKSKLDSKKDILSFLYLKPTRNSKLGSRFNYTVYAPSKYDTLHSIQSPAVCGDCTLAKPETGNCYVTFNHLNTISKWVDNHKETINYKPDLFSSDDFSYLKMYVNGSYLRLGSQGDPVSIPIDITLKLAELYDYKFTSYTHVHSLEKILGYEKLTLVSCETVEQAKYFQNYNFRTARIVPEGEKLLPSEIVCPEQEGKTLNCSMCMLCNPSNENIKKNIVFRPHGTKKNKLIKYLKSQEKI